MTTAVVATEDQTSIFEGKTAGDAIDIAVNESKEWLTKMQTVTLEGYWKIGQLADELDTSYGKNTMDEFGTRLTAESQRTLSVSQLYRCRSFYQRIDTKKLQQLIDAKVSWTQVHQVTKADIDPKAIEAGISRVQAQEVEPTKFAEVVTQHNDRLNKARGAKGKSARASAGGGSGSDTSEPVVTARTFKGNITKATSTLEVASDAFGDVIILVDQYKRLPKDDKAKQKEGFAELKTRLKQFLEQAKKTLEYLNKAS